MMSSILYTSLQKHLFAHLVKAAKQSQGSNTSSEVRYLQGTAVFGPDVNSQADRDEQCKFEGS